MTAKKTAAPRAAKRIVTAGDLTTAGNVFWNRIDAARTAYPDALLLFKIGDFYESFDYDAGNVAKILNLTTRDGANKGEVRAMCGFPNHQFDNYLKKLVAAGHHVAVCEPGV